MARAKKEDLRENLKPDDIAEFYADYAENMRAMARIKNRIKLSFDDFKAIGGDPKNLQAAYKLENMDDPVAYLQGITKTAAILRIIPTATEETGQVNFLPAFELPSPEADAKVAMSRVRTDGYNSGKAGAVIDNCPYAAGSEEFVVWRDHWEEGASDRAKAKAIRNKGIEEAPTERRPRGRPRKQAAMAEAA